MRWIKRHFLDGYCEFPLRFRFLDINTGEEVGVYDLEYDPGEIRDFSTFTNRGYWEPIEEYLSTLNPEELRNGATALNNLVVNVFVSLDSKMDAAERRLNSAYSLMSSGLESKYASMNSRLVVAGNNLNSRVGSTETKISSSNTALFTKEQALSLLAPKLNPIFVGAKAKETPDAWDIGDSLATTAYVKKYIQDNILNFPLPPRQASFGSITTTQRGTEANGYTWKNKVSFSDPSDRTFDGYTIIKWGGTYLKYAVTNQGASDPIRDPYDGSLAVDNKTRNRYSSNGYEITFTAQQSHTFWARVFAYSSNGTFA